MEKFVFDEYIKLIDCGIEKYFPEKDELYRKVTDAARYSLKNGGKRIRPIIMLEFAKAFGGNTADVLPFAVALEMIHTYSLIHDDLPAMDNDDLRRGKPSCHKAFGEDTALLAGDALLTESFSVALESGADKSRVLKALQVLSGRAGIDGMIGGQVLDLRFETETPDTELLTQMCRMKTGALLCAAAEIGCILAGADENTVKTAKEYALKVGLAFQIIDDILDVVGDEALLGKPIGSDAQSGKTTFVTLLGLDASKQLAERLTDEALDLLSTLPADTSSIALLTRFLLTRKF